MLCVRQSLLGNYRNLIKIYIKDLGGAMHALRQTELAGKLQELNKVLLAKQVS